MRPFPPTRAALPASRRASKTAASLLGLALLLASCGAAAQASNLALALEPDGPFTQVPRSFAVFLTNTTDHILRLPRPYLDCSAIPCGILYLRLNFKPSGASRRVKANSGCTADFFHARDSILQQIASWETLLPGQSLATHAVLLDGETTGEASTYTLYVEYLPPYVTPVERAELTLRRVDIPDAELSSPKLVYVLPAKARR